MEKEREKGEKGKTKEVKKEKEKEERQSGFAFSQVEGKNERALKQERRSEKEAKGGAKGL